MSVHLFATKHQPFTRFVVEFGDEPEARKCFTRPRMSFGHCYKCRRKRRAYNLLIQVDYDRSLVFCKEKCR